MNRVTIRRVKALITCVIIVVCYHDIILSCDMTAYFLSSMTFFPVFKMFMNEKFMHDINDFNLIKITESKEVRYTKTYVIIDVHVTSKLLK